MTHKQLEFQAAVFGAKFNKICEKLQQLLVEGNTKELTFLSKKLKEELKEYNEQGLLGVAFIGAYNAGKSTTISALTGLRDTNKADSPIKIDADVATDKTTDFSWNSIKVIDTPGLWADREDHDEITYEAIKKADLLIFCLTYSLFDNLTVENFKNLAYKQQYRWKMMLVVNKMSMEAGDEAEKINNYRKSLAKSLEPEDINEFTICFIDAKDYCDGIDEKDDDLINGSRFQSFIDALNAFVYNQGDRIKFDTPIRIALGCVDDADKSYSQTLNPVEDKGISEILNRLYKIIENERNILRSKIQKIIEKNSGIIIDEGTVLALAVGQQNFEILNQQSANNVKRHYETTQKEIEEAFNLAIKSVKEEQNKVFESELYKAIEASMNSRIPFSFTSVNTKNTNESSNILNDFKEIIIPSAFLAGKKIRDSAINEDTKQAMKNADEALEEAKRNWEKFKNSNNEVEKKAAENALVNAQKQRNQAYKLFLNDDDVKNSDLVNIVEYFGKVTHHQFKPGEAIGIAKNIGNAAKFLGYATMVAYTVADIIKFKQEKDYEKQIANIRDQIGSQFKTVTEDLKIQGERSLSNFEKDFFQEEKQKIDNFKNQQEAEIISSNNWIKRLREIRKELEILLNDVKPEIKNN